MPIVAIDFIRTYTAQASARITALNPTHIGTVAGIRFFEHPTKGDESPMIVKSNGIWHLTDFWDMPTLEELM